MSFPSTKSTLKLDGGNVVDNAKDKAVLTKRAVIDNNMHAQEFVNKLEKDLATKGVFKEICLIDDFGDTTGHSDGRVSFLDADTILVADYGLGGFDLDKQALIDAFGVNALTIVKLASVQYPTDPNSGFTNAKGAYINMAVTDKAIYVPQFGADANDPKDKAAMDVIRANTNKSVFGVNTGELGHMGGNVRCMTWQMYADHAIATALKQGAFTKAQFKKSMKSTSERNILISKILRELEKMA